MTDSLQSQDRIARVRSFVVANFLFGADSPALTSSTSFVEAGIVDSTGVLELVAFLEESFGVQIADGEITLDNLDSLAKVAAFLQRKATK